MHGYYLKDKDVMDYEIKFHNTWIFKGILKQRVKIVDMQQHWNVALQQNKFRVTTFHNTMIEDENKVPWSKMVKYNKARPRAVVCLWMACHGKLATRDKLWRFGLIQDSVCVRYVRMKRSQLTIYSSASTKLNQFERIF
ncbi:unnamed protein product [Lathyrus sativus]|nr:unnamed protein product [Lathyrus sativus]